MSFRLLGCTVSLTAAMENPVSVFGTVSPRMTLGIRRQGLAGHIRGEGVPVLPTRRTYSIRVVDSNLLREFNINGVEVLNQRTDMLANCRTTSEAMYVAQEVFPWQCPQPPYPLEAEEIRYRVKLAEQPEEFEFDYYGMRD